MTSKGLQVERFVLRRSIDLPRTAVTHNLLPGRVYVLVDSEGANIEPYLKFFRGTETDKMTLEWNGEDLPRQQWARAGFADKFPENSTITSFLADSGVPAAEIPATLAAYDLDRSAYLACVQLSVTAQRQLSLLAALRNDAKLLVLYDPFQPFSGRWREKFAEEILSQVQNEQRCAVIVNLSFMPQCWIEKSTVVKVDVQAAAVEAINRAIGIEEEQKRKAAQKAAEAAKMQAAAAKANSEKQTELTEKLIKDAELSTREPTAEGELPQPPLYFVYKGVRDFIFEPLAELSNFLRGWSGAIAALAVVALTASMAFVFVPALGTSNSGFASFAKAWNKGQPSAANPSPPRSSAAGLSPSAAGETGQLSGDSPWPPSVTEGDEWSRGARRSPGNPSHMPWSGWSWNASGVEGQASALSILVEFGESPIKNLCEID